MLTRPEHILEQIEKWPAGAAGEFLATEGDLEVRIHLADWDRLGCVLEKLEMKGPDGTRLKPDPIRMEKEINYLGEPLKIIELEKHCGRALLRSYPPRSEDGGPSFFELMVDPVEGLCFKRLAYDRILGKRYQTPVPLTRDTLLRLLGDLVRLLTPN